MKYFKRFHTNTIKIITVFLLTYLIFPQNHVPVKNALASPVDVTLQNVENLNKEQNYEASIGILLNALSRHPNSQPLIITFRQTFSLHLYQQIAHGYQQIEENKHNTHAYLAIARAYGLIGDKIKTLETLTDGITENPKSVELWMAIGAIELDSKREKEAFSVFKEILHIDPNNSLAHNNIAHILAKSEEKHFRNLKEAVWHSQKALTLEPSNANYLDTLAEIKFQMGKTKEAVLLIKQAIELSPEEEFFKSQLNRFESSSH